MAFDVGVMFTASAYLPETLEKCKELGITQGQMAIPGDFVLDHASLSSALESAGFRIHTLFGVYEGESYVDIPTVRSTVGFLPTSTREERVERTLQLLRTAAALKIPSIATHIGFVPEDRDDPDYAALREAVRHIADAAAECGITFALETGQETAPALLEFILDVDRKNVGINFDPANMILYGTGDPVDALELVGQHVLSVHAKDGLWPPAEDFQALGTEMPLGQGAVDFPSFLTMLRKVGYEKPLFIERETPDEEQRLRDIAAGRAFLQNIGAD